MEQSFFESKQKQILIILMALSVIVYLFTGLNGILISVALVISSAVLSLVIASFTAASRTVAALLYLVLLTAAGIFIYHDIVDALIFTASVAAVGITLGLGIRSKKPFSEYMITAIVMLFIVSVFSLVYDLALLGTKITVDNVIDYFMSPSLQIIESYSQIFTAHGITIDTKILSSTMRDMAIGTFCAAITLQVFFSYILAGLINIKLKVSKESLFETLKAFNISRIGAVLFVIAAFINIWTTEGTIKLFALNFYTIMQFPMTLCGILAVYRLMALYKAKIRTKRIAVGVLTVLSIIPVLNISSGLAFVGAFDSIVSLSTPKDRGKEVK